MVWLLSIITIIQMKHIQGSKTVPANPNDVIQMKHSKFLKIRVPESIKKRVSQ